MSRKWNRPGPLGCSRPIRRPSKNHESGNSNDLLSITSLVYFISLLMGLHLERLIDSRLLSFIKVDRGKYFRKKTSVGYKSSFEE